MKREHLQQLSQAIKEKFGEQVLQDVRQTWNNTKELNYKKDVRERNKKLYSSLLREEKDGFVIRKKLVSSDDLERTCSKCDKFSFSIKDKFYLRRFGTCEKCYILHIEGRE